MMNMMTPEQTPASHSEQATIDTLQAMRRQEELHYVCTNSYPEHNPLNPAAAVSCSAYDVVTIQTRTLLCDWANKIIDFCNLDRETVEIAFSYVDRYVATEEGREILQQSDKFQLLVVTSLYVAIKVHETVAISTSQFEKISRNTFTAADVEKMEVKLLKGLKWHLHPPTSLCFVRLFLDLIPRTAMNQDMKHTAFLLAKIQSELATRDCALISTRASTIAFASVMNAFEALGMLECIVGSNTVHIFISKIASLSLVHKAVFYNDLILRPIQIRLYQAIAKQSNEITAFVSARRTTAYSAHDPASPTSPAKGVISTKSFEKTPRSVIHRTA